jgi:hypothetical protein
MTIYVDHVDGAQSPVPKFRVELRNAGGNDLILDLGMVLARQYPNFVVLTLTDAQGKSRRFDLREPGVIIGIVRPLAVPLPAGSTFSIPVNLDKYWAAASMEFDYKLKPGAYSIEAQFTGRSASEGNFDPMSYWKGAVTSNQLRFRVSGK